MTAVTSSPITPDDTIVDLAERFFSPARSPAKPWPAAAAAVALELAVHPVWGKPVRLLCHRLGDGPPVLLVHGWQSQGADLLALAQALADAGFSVWTPDLPAHGHSAGTRLSIPLAAQALLAVQAVAGPLAAAIGHSFGGASLVHALTQGLSAARVVLLAPPTHLGAYVRQTAVAAGLEPAAVERFVQHVSVTLGEPADGIDMRRQVAGLRQPALLLHSEDDKVVPAAATRRVAGHWQGARFVPLQGLGHVRLLGARPVLDEIVAFVRPQ